MTGHINLTLVKDSLNQRILSFRKLILTLKKMKRVAISDIATPQKRCLLSSKNGMSDAALCEAELRLAPSERGVLYPCLLKLIFQKCRPVDLLRWRICCRWTRDTLGGLITCLPAESRGRFLLRFPDNIYPTPYSLYHCGKNENHLIIKRRLWGSIFRLFPNLLCCKCNCLVNNGFECAIGEKYHKAFDGDRIVPYT